MGKKDPFTYQVLRPRRLRSLNTILDRAENIGPWQGFSVGGSSRTDSGATIAATRGIKRQRRGADDGQHK